MRCHHLGQHLVGVAAHALPQQAFVAAAARRGISVTPAGAFAVGPGHAPNAVRLALSSPPPDTLSHALGVLAELAHGTPDDAGPD
ncbi:MULTISPECIES: hypothetical protein [Streptomyces]|uniref:hypothetical protein n=1 Tax=Streptomyces TaxID=1883 RepID=UPI0036B35F4E